MVKEIFLRLKLKWNEKTKYIEREYKILTYPFFSIGIYLIGVGLFGSRCIEKIRK